MGQIREVKKAAIGGYCHVGVSARGEDKIGSLIDFY